MKKLLSILSAAVLLLCTVSAAFAAEVFAAPVIGMLAEESAENDRSFTFSVTAEEAFNYESRRLELYNGLLRKYGSEALTEAALKAAGQEAVLYPTALLAQIETEGESHVIGTYALAKSVTLTLQKDILPALTAHRAFTGEAFVFRLRFYIAAETGGTPTLLSGGTYSKQLHCPAAAYIEYSGCEGAENPNPAYLFTPFEGFRLQNPERTGYIFAGWANADTGEYVNAVPADAQGLRLRADWTPREYAVNYVLTTREGYSFVQVNNAGNPTVRHYGTDTDIYDVIAPYGYIFMGWYESPDFSGERVRKIPGDRTGDIILYAKWRTPEEKEDEYIARIGYGDVDGDSHITAEDARLALRAAVGLETLSPEAFTRANITGGAEITAESARLILRIAVELDDLKEVLKTYGII